MLGGVVVAGAPGLAGHSDADVVSHAVADSLLGAAGLGDLGGLFPDSSDEWKGADSSRLLARVVDLLASNGFKAINSDCTVVCERPRLHPHTGQMESNLSSVTGAPVSVKAKRAEGLGALGRVEGIACFCVSLVELSESEPGNRT